MKKNIAKLAYMQECDEKNESLDELNEGVTPSSEYPNIKVKISRDQFALFQLYRKAKDREEIIIDPDFQRNFVWGAKQKSELIESILMGIPLPVFYFFEQKDGKQQVVDGRQRLTAIFMFMKGDFSLSGLCILPELNGKKFSELSPLFQGKIEDYQVTVYMIQPPTPERIKFDIFDRVNRSGTSLNHQEMRNALHQGASTELLRRLSENENFKLATDNAVNSKRMKDQYIILRFLAFYMYFNAWKELEQLEYRSDIDDFLAKIMDIVNTFDSETLEKLENVFDKSMRRCYETLGGDAFRFSPVSSAGKKRPVNMALYEALSFFFSDEKINFTMNKDEICKKIAESKDSLWKESFSTQIDNSVKVKERFNTIMALQKEFEV